MSHDQEDEGVLVGEALSSDLSELQISDEPTPSSTENSSDPTSVSFEYLLNNFNIQRY